MLQRLSETYRQHRYDPLLWLLYAGFWYVMFSPEISPVVNLKFTGLHITGQILTTYLVVYGLIPRFLYPRNYWAFGWLYAGLLGVATGHLYVGVQLVFWGQTAILGELARWDSVITYGLIMNLFTNVLVAGIKIMYDRLQAENRTRQLETEKAEAELRFLKAQINPHFLFNSLNSIFQLVDQDPDQAKELITTFSEMLQYHLYETNTEKVPLAMELDYIRSYANMEQVRRGNNLTIDLQTDTDGGYLEVAPLILLTFVENAFKHVSAHLNQPNRVRICVSTTGDTLYAQVWNTKETVLGRSLPPDEGGIGLANVRRRLDLMYPDQYSLLVRDGAEDYEVKLTLTPRA